MHIWPDEKKRDFVELTKPSLGLEKPGKPVLSEADTKLIVDLRADVLIRNTVEKALVCIAKYHPQLDLWRGDTKVAGELKLKYANVATLPEKQQPPVIVNFAREMRKIMGEFQQFHRFVAPERDVNSLTLFELFDLYDLLIDHREAFSSGSFHRPLANISVPVGTPFLPAHEPRNRTLDEVIHDFLPGLDVSTFAFTPSLNPVAAFVAKLRDVPLVYSPTNLRTYLPILENEILPGLEKALLRFSALRPEAIVENLIVVRRNLMTALEVPAPSPKQRDLEIERIVACDLSDCLLAIQSSFDVRRQLTTYIDALKHAVHFVTESLTLSDPVQFPHRKQLFQESLRDVQDGIRLDSALRLHAVTDIEFVESEPFVGSGVRDFVLHDDWKPPAISRGALSSWRQWMGD